MSTLTSFKDGSLGSGPNMAAVRDGSLGNHMQAYQNGSFGNLNSSSYRDGSLGCGCGISGLGTEGTATPLFPLTLLAILGGGLFLMYSLSKDTIK